MTEQETEDSIRDLVADGMVEIVGKDEHGHDVYRLTPAGMRRAEQLLGLIRGELKQ